MRRCLGTTIWAGATIFTGGATIFAGGVTIEVSPATRGLGLTGALRSPHGRPQFPDPEQPPRDQLVQVLRSLQQLEVKGATSGSSGAATVLRLQMLLQRREAASVVEVDVEARAAVIGHFSDQRLPTQLASGAIQEEGLLRRLSHRKN